MGVFVRIETGDQWPDSDFPEPRFLGSLVADEIQAVTNYELVRLPLDWREDQPFIRIERYPRWSEPGLALLARLVEKSEPSFLAEPLRSLPLTIALSVGASPDSSEVVELITTERGLHGFGVVFVSQVRHEVVRMPLPHPDITLRDAVLELCRTVFRWHRQCGPLPAPLSHVSIREGVEGPVVAIEDIPPHPRAYIRLRYDLDDSATTVPARLWLDFICQLMPGIGTA
jgi:hypothetical protein